MLDKLAACDTQVSFLLKEPSVRNSTALFCEVVVGRGESLVQQAGDIICLFLILVHIIVKGNVDL